jgi:chromosome segregation ATPase
MDLKEKISTNDYNNQYNKYPNSRIFRDEINILQQQLPSVLDDYKKYYVFFNKNPEVSEYQQMFDNIDSNMQQTNNELANIATNISKTISEINDELLELNEKIEIEKTKNTRLNKLLGNIQNEENGANEMMNDYTEIYNMLYLRNIAMMVGIFGCIFIAKKIVSY